MINISFLPRKGLHGEKLKTFKKKMIESFPSFYLKVKYYVFLTNSLQKAISAIAERFSSNSCFVIDG